MSDISNKLFLPTKVFTEFLDKIKFVLLFLFIYPTTVMLYCMFGIAAAVIGFIAAGSAFYFFRLYRLAAGNSPVSIALAAFISVFSADSFRDFLHSTVDFQSRMGWVLEIVCISVFLFMVLCVFFGAVLIYGSDGKAEIKGAVRMLASFGSFVFIVLVYLPCDTYINNFSDFNFPISAFIFSFIGQALLYLIPAAYLGLVLKEKPLSFLTTLFCGLTLCVYVQYMFMNRNLGLMMGESVSWSDYTVYGAVTFGVWILLLVLVFAMRILLKKFWKKISVVIPAFIGAMQILSLAMLFMFTENDIYGYRNNVLDGREQYTVSQDKNIVTFVFDAVDNNYFDSLLSSSPEVFQGFEDFTLYTNTCSVHDYTLASMTQMLTGTVSCPMYDTGSWLEEAWGSDMTKNFYGRLHEAGYTMNAYMNSEVPVELLEGKFDNCSSDLEPSFTDGDGIINSLLTLNRYRYMPFLFKRFFDTTGVDFKSFVSYSDEFNYYNDDYFNGLKLKKSGSDKKYFIIEHLNGAHFPCDDPVEETKKCLNIAKEYMRQMKELGVYENSTIVITSDHGRHTSNFNNGAATPVFMIKKAGDNKDGMKITNAPVYHTDFLSTYLVSAGIYSDEDKDIYGPSVFDLKEDQIRERIWFDHTYDGSYPNPDNAACNVYYAYKYAGDDLTLKELVCSKSPSEVIVKE